MTAYKYKVDIRWSDEDEAFIARAPELDGVVTHGATIIEAAKNLDVAIRLHLKSLKKHNEPIPRATSLDKLKGQYPLRMGKERHQDLVVKAAQAGVSVNEYLNRIIDESENYELELRAPTVIRSTSKSYGVKSSKKTVRTTKKRF